MAQHIGPVLRALDHEETWVLALDGQRNLRGSRRVAQGGNHGCSITSREILRAALMDGASAMILAHNHPSGDPFPSTDDLQLTRTVADAGLVAGVPLVDHVIVTPEGKLCSMLGMGIVAPSMAPHDVSAASRRA